MKKQTKNTKSNTATKAIAKDADKVYGKDTVKKAARTAKKVVKKAPAKKAVKKIAKRPVNAKVATRRVAAKYRAFTTRGGVRRYMARNVKGKGVEFIYGHKIVDEKTLFFPIVTNLGNMSQEQVEAYNVKVDTSIETV